MTDTAHTQPPVAPKRRWSLVHWLVVFFIVMIVGDLLGTFLPQWTASWQAWSVSRDCEQAISWVKTSHPAPGVYRQLALPDQLRSIAADGLVDAVVLPDGRIVLLFKTAFGKNGTWEGFIFSSAPLKPSEIGPNSRGDDRIKISGIQDHWIDQKINDRYYRVGF